MKKQTMSFIAGAVTSAVLFSGGAAYAAGIMAEHAPQTAYVDGKAIQLDAYNIGGYNYVKLRDVGQAVGFNVYWDGQYIQVDTDAPYTGTGPTQATSAAEPIRVGSFKGSTLKAGELGALIVYPYDPDDTAVSSDPSVLGLRYVMGHWTAEAKKPGTATITIKAADGRSGSVTITVVPDDSTTDAGTTASPAAASGQSRITLTDNLEVRQEMVRLINQVRRENGVPDLVVNDALMDAAQAFSAKRYTQHNTKEECELVSRYGYPYGFNNNLTVFTGAVPAYIAQTAVRNWINSPGHFQAMIDPRCDCIGIGVTISGGMTYCQMFAGIPNSYTMFS